MANNANAAALAAEITMLLIQMRAAFSTEGPPPHDVEIANWLGGQLAAHGVLAPAALTDDECHDVLDASYRAADIDGEPSVRPSRFRQALAALAQGRPAPSWPPTEG